MRKVVLFFVSLVFVLGVSNFGWAAEESAAKSAVSTDSKSEKSAPDAKSNVKLRVVAVNPSKEKPQTVPIKIFLPKEIIPDDIIEMGDLKVGYDSGKGVYFAYSDGVELKPQETRVFEVQLEDVWRIKDQQLSKMRDETQNALKHLEKTPHYANAKAIVDSIDRRLNEIEVKQKDDTISREEHIGAYRVNLMTMDQVKQDIALLEKMLQASGGPPSIEFLKDTVFEKKDNIDRITAWKLILAIIGLICLLGVAFYLKWFLALKIRQKPAGGDAKSDLRDAPFIGEHVDEASNPPGGKIAAATPAEDYSKIKKK